jgi:hypothetical protein
MQALEIIKTRNGYLSERERLQAQPLWGTSMFPDFASIFTPLCRVYVLYTKCRA